MEAEIAARPLLYSIVYAVKVRPTTWWGNALLQTTHHIWRLRGSWLLSIDPFVVICLCISTSSCCDYRCVGFPPILLEMLDVEMDFTDESTSDNPQVLNQDIITSLLEVPFLQRSNQERSEILKRGRYTPRFTLLKKYKNHTRTFNASWYDQHKWLCGSGARAKLFCWPCLLLHTNNTVWSAEGYDDLKNLSRALVRHECSKDHLNAHLSLNNMSKQILKVSELVNEHSKLQKAKYNEEVKKNRDVFKILIDVATLLLKQGPVFSYGNEAEESISRGNFKADIFMFMLKRNPDLKQHLENTGCFTGVSESVQNHLIDCFKDEIKQQIESDINQAPFFACVVHETVDVFEESQCSIAARLVDPSGDIQEHFLGFFDIKEHRTADGLCTVLCKALEKFNVQNKLIAQTYDGACITGEVVYDLQAKVRKLAPQALFTHSYANRLNLVLQQSCCKIKAVRIFFAALQGLSAFFDRLLTRSDIVDKVLGKRIPTCSEIAWDCDSKIVSAVHTNRLKLIEVLRELENSSPDSTTIREAYSYSHHLEDFTFVFLLLVFQHIFQQTDNLFNTLKNKLTTPFCNGSVLKRISTLRDLRVDSKYEEFLHATEAATGSSVLKRHLLGNEDSTNYYRQIYFEVLDDILTQLEARFSSCEQLIFLKLGDPINFSLYDKKFPSEALSSLVEVYGVHFNKEKLRTELETVFSPVHEETFHSLSLSALIKKMNVDGTSEILPEAYKLFTLIATIPASSASVEKGSSCLSRITNYLRKCTSQERFDTLALVSIEKEVLAKLESRASWHDDVIDRFAKKDDRVNLLYK